MAVVLVISPAGGELVGIAETMITAEMKTASLENMMRVWGMFVVERTTEDMPGRLDELGKYSLIFILESSSPPPA